MTKTNTILKTIILCVICAATMMSGCLETTTTDEYGTTTHNIATDRTIVDIDTYVDGIHITGTDVYYGEDLVSRSGNFEGHVNGMYITGTVSGTEGNEIYNGNVDWYIEGNHVTGTYSKVGAGDWCCDWYMKVDMYTTTGAHVTGYSTLKGCGDDVEWYRVLTSTKVGYKTQYLNGYNDAEWRGVSDA